MPGVSKAATECNRRVAELQKLAAALASGSDEALELAAAAGDVEAQAGEDGGEAQEPPAGAGEGAAAEEPEPLMVPAPSRSDSTTAGGADGFDAFLSPQPAELAHSDLGSVSDFGGMMSASPFTAASSSSLIGGVSGSLGDQVCSSRRCRAAAAPLWGATPEAVEAAAEQAPSPLTSLPTLGVEAP